jgi:hypothetical protein
VALGAPLAVTAVATERTRASAHAATSRNEMSLGI